METKEAFFFHIDDKCAYSPIGVNPSVKCAFIVQKLFFRMALSAAPHSVITVTLFCNP